MASLLSENKELATLFLLLLLFFPPHTCMLVSVSTKEIEKGASLVGL